LNNTSPGCDPEREARVVAATVAGVGHVHEVVVHSDADRLDSAGSDEPGGELPERPIGPDPQHRDLVAAGIDRQQVATVLTHLEGSL
jgi:hypothetical protein